ncbi:MAG: SEL1-like repeat protein [Notoacmeibacter sp.]|nr:SEL1-like repeat protein [Notoacmeibacter sp.]
MTSSISREFEALRHQLSGVYADVRAGQSTSDIAPELDRISQAVRSLSERSNDRGISDLHLEVEELKHAVGELAREESLRAVQARWNDFDRRWDHLETHLMDESAASSRNGRAVEALAARLDAINTAIAHIPSTSALHSLDDKVHTLSLAVEKIAQTRAVQSPDLYEMVENRLDEISRAIVASSVANQPASIDYAPMERIEARISSLTSQIGDLLDQGPNEAQARQLSELAERVDALAASSALPAEALERVASQLASITNHIASAPAVPDMGVVLNAIEERILALSDMVEEKNSDVSRQSLTMFRDLEGKLLELGERLEEAAQGTSGNASSSIAIDLERRFEALNGRLDQSSQRQRESEQALMGALDERFREIEDRFAASRRELQEQVSASALHGMSPGFDSQAVESLEARLNEIAARLEETAMQPRGSDREMIESLEAQISNLSTFMSNPVQRFPELESLSPRLEEIEKALAHNQESILEVARAAAEDAIRSASVNDAGQRAAVEALADDLKALDHLARRSEERNAKTFEAIHETLLKVVDRLAQLEMTGITRSNAAPAASKTEPVMPKAEPAMPKAEKLKVEHAPALEAEEHHLIDPVLEPETAPVARNRSKMSPAEAAAAAAFAAVKAQGASGEKASDGKGSLIGGLARVLKSKKAETTAGIPQADPDLDAFETGEIADEIPADDEFLEPGSVTPDLNAIMSRVKSERSEGAERAEADASKADFIAAARRAAQAAAAEAEILKGRSADAKGGSRMSPAALFQQKRKPILMAAGAIMIVLAGLQVGKMVFSSDGDQLASAPEVVSTEPVKTADIPRASETVTSESAPVLPDVRVIDEPDTAKAEPSPAPEADMPAASSEQEVTPETVVPSAEDAPDAGEDVAALAIDFGPAALREAVASNDPKAYYEVGARYADGRGVAADMEKSAEWIRRSAEAGFAPAQYRIGNYFEKGTGVERDLDAAKTWYQMAAEQGNASAMHNLAVLFANAPDGQPDYESAAKWFLNAAEMGVKDSQFNLGIMAAKGVGMKPDMEASYKWFAVAARNGDKDAADKRDEVAKALRPEQLDKARAAADLWKPRDSDPSVNTPEMPESWREANETTASVDMKKAVRNIQLILNKNGFDAGTADGVMGAKTRDAIMAFQKANKLPATGEVDDALIKLLLAKK